MAIISLQENEYNVKWDHIDHILGQKDTFNHYYATESTKVGR